MKTTTRYFAGVVIMLAILSASLTLSAKSKTAVVTIQTSAVCDHCKARIEKALKASDGVITASLNLDDKKIKVKYNSDKTTPDQIRAVIASTGYDADGVKRNPDAFGKLPKCCQK